MLVMLVISHCWKNAPGAAQRGVAQQGLGNGIGPPDTEQGVKGQLPLEWFAERTQQQQHIRRLAAPTS
jgi:hypothetical protein